MLLTDEEIIGAIRLNPNKNWWTEKDWDAQITKEYRLIAKAQLKKVVEWSMEDCDSDVEREHPIHRHFCPRCWQALLKETE